MAQVTSKTQTISAADLQPDPGDIWGDFRDVEVLSLEFTQSYRHSLGKYSRFFLALEEKRFLATRCDECAQTYAPPRPMCPACRRVTTWVELPGTGQLVTYSVMHFGSAANADVVGLETPYILAYVLLDGATTLFPHILRTDPAAVAMGMRVRVAYIDGPVQHPIHLMHFVPLEG